MHTSEAVSTTCSLNRWATTGITTRMAAAAIAKAPRMLPMTEALRPLSWPSTGTTKVWTSQQDDIIQLTSIKRRNMGSCRRSQALAREAPSTGCTGGSSRVSRTQNQVSNGNSAMSRKAAR